MLRASPETMPRVTEFSYPSGLPMATAYSPTFGSSVTKVATGSCESGAHLDHGQVGQRIAAHDGGRQLLAGGKGDLELGHRISVVIGDHVVVGDDHPVGRVDHPRAFTGVLLLPERPLVAVPEMAMLTTLGPSLAATSAAGLANPPSARCRRRRW